MNHEIRVDITSARLNHMVITLPQREGDLPQMTAQIGLLTPDGKQVSTFEVSTQSYVDKKNRIDIPATALFPIAALRDVIGELVTAKCAQQFTSLPAPSQAVESTGEVL